MDRKKLRPQSWPECPTLLSLPIAYVSDNGTQTDKITCDHKAEINKYELIILQKQLLKYNKETFSRFMLKNNDQLRHEIRPNIVCL